MIRKLLFYIGVPTIKNTFEWDTGNSQETNQGFITYECVCRGLRCDCEENNQSIPIDSDIRTIIDNTKTYRTSLVATKSGLWTLLLARFLDRLEHLFRVFLLWDGWWWHGDFLFWWWSQSTDCRQCPLASALNSNAMLLDRRGWASKGCTNETNEEESWKSANKRHHIG